MLKYFCLLGSIVANYPYDTYTGGSKTGIAKYSSTNDDDVFRRIAYKYSSTHLSMIGANCYGETFFNGITNGGNSTFN